MCNEVDLLFTVTEINAVIAFFYPLFLFVYPWFVQGLGDVSVCCQNTSVMTGSK